MRILILSTDAQPVPPEHYGGIERVVAEVAAGLIRRGHEVALLALAGSHLRGATCLTWRESTGLPRSIGRGLQALVAARRFEAEFIHSFGQTKWVVPWCLSGGKALISYGVLPQLRARGPIRLFRDRLLLAGCSDYLSTAGAARVSGRWRTAYNCLDVRGYRFEQSVAANAPLVFLSRIDWIKGLDIAIDIAERSGRRLMIAGNHADEGESGHYWRDVVRPRLTSPRIEYVGPVNDQEKGELLGQAAAMVVPIRWDEPFGMVFIEALACGTPVISCPRGALPEIVRSGVEGFLAEQVEDLVRAVDRLGEIDRHACRRRVEECFSTERTAAVYENLYRELLSASSPQPELAN